MTATIAIIEPRTDEARIKVLWEAFCKADAERSQRGLEFGHAMYELRQRSELVPGGTTFRRVIESLGIPHTTAYRWIARYEESIGVRQVEMGPVTIDRDITSADQDIGGVELGTKRAISIAEANKNRIIEGLSLVGGALGALDDLGPKLERAARRFTDEDLDAFIKKTDLGRTQLHHIRVALMQEVDRRQPKNFPAI
jgi:hypothetical protein